MRIFVDVEPLDLPEVPRSGTMLPVVFGDQEMHHVLVLRAEHLEDGRMRLECDLMGAQMVGAWPEDQSPVRQLVQPGLGKMTPEEYRAIRRNRRLDG